MKSYITDNILKSHEKELNEIMNNELSKQSLNDKQSHEWISQEFLFNVEFIHLCGAVLSHCPFDDMQVILRLINNCLDHAIFLKNKLNMKTEDIKMNKMTEKYSQFLRSLQNQRFEIQLPLIWLVCHMFNSVVEKNINESLKDIAEDWKHRNFQDLCNELKNFSDCALQKGGVFEQELKPLSDKLVHLEKESWNKPC